MTERAYYRLLVAEDEKVILDNLVLNLEMEGYEVVSARNGREALDILATQHVDLVILDIMMPEISGYDVLQKMRFTDSKTPVMFLTAKGEGDDRVKGLKSGADDYLTKPFHLEELLLRVKNLLKRHPAATTEHKSDPYVFGGNRINFITRQAYNQHGRVELTTKEFQVMKLLIDRAGEVVLRQQMLQLVWGYDIYPSTRTIDNFILNLRKKFETDPANPFFIQSVRGLGYKFNPA